MLKRFKLNKTNGDDQFAPKMVKMCFKVLSVTLMELLNYVFKNKKFPYEMKKTEIAIKKT